VKQTPANKCKSYLKGQITSAKKGRWNGMEWSDQLRRWVLPSLEGEEIDEVDRTEVQLRCRRALELFFEAVNEWPSGTKSWWLDHRYEKSSRSRLEAIFSLREVQRIDHLFERQDQFQKQAIDALRERFPEVWSTVYCDETKYVFIATAEEVFAYLVDLLQTYELGLVAE
jgi:hypothetical protein